MGISAVLALLMLCGMVVGPAVIPAAAASTSVYVNHATLMDNPQQTTLGGPVPPELKRAIFTLIRILIGIGLIIPNPETGFNIPGRIPHSAGLPTWSFPPEKSDN